MSSAQILRQIVVMIPVSMMGFLSGMGYAWVATNMSFLRSTQLEIPYTNKQCTVLAVLLPIGRMSTIFVNVLVLGKLGRKPPLVISALMFFISSGVIVATKVYLAVVFSRFLYGIAVGIFDCFSTMYIGEVAMKNIRGTISCCATACFNFGVICQYVLGFYLSYDDAAITTLTIAVIMVLSTYYLIESPYYLATNNQTDKALEVLVWLQLLEVKTAEKELRDISKNPNPSLSNFFKLFKNPEIYKSFVILLSLGFLSTILTTTFISFANFIIPDTKFLNSEHFAIFLNTIPAVMSILSALCIDHLGRRKLLLVGFSLGIFLNTIITLLYYIEEKSFLKIANFSLIIFALIALLLIILSLCVSPTIVALRTELFPITHKIFGVSSNIMLNSLALSLTTVFFMEVALELGIYLNFLLYCLSCVIGLVFVSYVLPETKGKSLTEIQEILKAKKPTNSR